MKVIRVNHSKSQINSETLQTLVNAICADLLKKKVRNKKFLKEKKEITLVFLSRNEMRKVNKQFRKKNKPTDILSFNSHDPRSLGELLLCSEVLQEQAKRQQHPLHDEIAYMLIHGMLHLLGYDHEASESEEKLMFRLQDKCFSEVVRSS